MHPDYFADLIFPPEQLRSLLSPQEQTLGRLTDMRTANRVAQAMEQWATDRGATHYCHWFQPLTGITAEKHMSFLSGFTGKQLLLGESDASSFPTGGLRQTAYARGYTAWDQTAPVFLKGKVLCIPTVFLSSTGEALDLKTPLLRSMEALDIQARRLLGLFGRTDVQKVTPMVGPEQEYFLLDRQQYNRRWDLRCCGRTLFGAPPPRGQQLDDRYYGVIAPRAAAFMETLNEALWHLGIPAAAQHNEVAPSQYELAPVYAPAHIACDRDQLTMELLATIARQEGLVCLLHEKPFALLNGSGKHVNWSLETDQGENLLEPQQTGQFRLLLSCILQGIDLHGDLLRLSAGAVGNDLRLGGQEAPPCVVSVFLGDRVQALLFDRDQSPEDTTLDPGLGAVRPMATDGADRNRTAPLAFTGNKLEFRMVGASQSVATAVTYLNAVAAEAFCRAADALEGAKDPASACRSYISRLLQEHGRILYSGDCYSQAWQQESAARGLRGAPSLVDAIPALEQEKARALFSGLGIFTPAELQSRTEVLYTEYAARIQIEGTCMVQTVWQQLLPAVVEYLGRLKGETALELGLCRKLRTHLRTLESAAVQLEEALSAARQLPIAPAAARAFRQQVIPAMEALRRAADSLEALTGRSFWPLPSYGELLFEV